MNRSRSPNINEPSYTMFEGLPEKKELMFFTVISSVRADFFAVESARKFKTAINAYRSILWKVSIFLLYLFCMIPHSEYNRKPFPPR